MRKILISFILMVSIVLVGCSSNSNSNESSSGDNEQVFKLAHNLSEDQVVHKALEDFAEQIEERTDGEIKIDIYPNGQLGQEKEALGQIENGTIEMTKVSAGTLESFNEIYKTFSVPYIFKDEDHYRDVMESDIMDNVYNSTEDNGFIGLSYIDSGARSFYTKDKPILSPDDLKGMKIRTMDSVTATKMMENLGGTATPMGYAEIYTSLQQGVIDGAESNPTALTEGKHGEVVNHFVFNEHTMIPDILVINKETWDNLSDEQKEIFKEVASENRVKSSEMWKEEIDRAVEEAKDMGVEFHEVDKAPFIEKVQPIHEEYKENDALREIIEQIEALG